MLEVPALKCYLLRNSECSIGTIAVGVVVANCITSQLALPLRKTREPIIALICHGFYYADHNLELVC
jgi:hypothetical protein